MGCCTVSKLYCSISLEDEDGAEEDSCRSWPLGGTERAVLDGRQGLHGRKVLDTRVVAGRRARIGRANKARLDAIVSVNCLI